MIDHKTGTREEWLAARVGGGILVLAGLYQLTPLKRICLAKCCTPLDFIHSGWRDGYTGVFRMGLEHGIYCLGSNWLLFVLLPGHHEYRSDGRAYRGDLRRKNVPPMGAHCPGSGPGPDPLWHSRVCRELAVTLRNAVSMMVTVSEQERSGVIPERNALCLCRTRSPNQSVLRCWRSCNLELGRCGGVEPEVANYAVL